MHSVLALLPTMCKDYLVGTTVALRPRLRHSQCCQCTAAAAAAAADGGKLLAVEACCTWLLGLLPVILARSVSSNRLVDCRRFLHRCPTHEHYLRTDRSREEDTAALRSPIRVARKAEIGAASSESSARCQQVAHHRTKLLVSPLCMRSPSQLVRLSILHS